MRASFVPFEDFSLTLIPPLSLPISLTKLRLSSSPFELLATVWRGCSPRIQKREGKGTGTGHTTRAMEGREAVEGGAGWVDESCVVWMKRKGRYI